MFQNAFTRQSSFEQRWQDVESVLSLRHVSERSVEFRAALAGRGECVGFTVRFRMCLRVSQVSSSAGRTWSVLSLRCVSECIYASVEFRAALAGRGECVKFTVCFRTRLRVSRVSSSAGRTWRV